MNSDHKHVNFVYILYKKIIVKTFIYDFKTCIIYLLILVHGPRTIVSVRANYFDFREKPYGRIDPRNEEDHEDLWFYCREPGC